MSNPARWRVLVSRRAERVLRRLPRDVLERISSAIDGLATDSHPAGSLKLSGYDLYRIRVGAWRIIYAVQDDELVVLILTVAPRGEAYRNL
jgi:mRNA interferase RelE/StbE